MATTREFIVEASRLLNDPRNENWSVRELLEFFNAGLKAFVRLEPSQFSVTEPVTLVAGTRQTVPADSAGLLRVARPISGGSPGRAARFVDRAALDAFDPAWHTASPGTTREWTYDQRHPYVYWVNPPASPGAILEIEHARIPADLTINATVPVDETHGHRLVSYVVARALSKDADYGNNGRAKEYMSQFEGKARGDVPASG